jgi:hypothetical protein
VRESSEENIRAQYVVQCIKAHAPSHLDSGTSGAQGRGGEIRSFVQVHWAASISTDETQRTWTKVVAGNTSAVSEWRYPYIDAPWGLKLPSNDRGASAGLVVLPRKHGDRRDGTRRPREHDDQRTSMRLLSHEYGHRRSSVELPHEHDQWRGGTRLPHERGDRRASIGLPCGYYDRGLIVQTPVRV